MPKLPVGLTWEEQVHRDVEFGAITGRVRRELLSLQGRGEAYKAFRNVIKLVVERIGDISPVEDNHILALPYADGEYIVYELVKYLYGDKPFETSGFCKDCNERSFHRVDWDELSVLYIEDTPFAQDGTMPFKLPVGVKNPATGKLCQHGRWRLPSLGDVEKALKSQAFGKPQQGAAIDFGRAEQANLLIAIGQIEGFSEGNEFTIADLDRMDLRDYNYLLRELYVEMREKEPGVKLPNKQCEFCGGTVQLRVNWLADFLLRLTA